jgi:hypothetical protein
MDERTFIGTIGSVASYTLADIHLAVAILAGLATIAYMAICIRDKLRKK